MIYIDDQIDQIDIAAVLPRLSEQRREQVLRYRFEQGRRQSAAAYLLLCQGLLLEHGLSEPPTFCYGEHGKPAIVGHPDICFNLSHCRSAAICAVGDRPVGIDIESIREYRESLVRYTMNETEVQQIEQSARPDVAFIQLWTMKESLLKLSGDGISNNMKDVLSQASPTIHFTTVVNLQRGYVYSLCEEQPT